MKSPLCALLGIKYPVFQGGMAWVAGASLGGGGREAGGPGHGLGAVEKLADAI